MPRELMGGVSTLPDGRRICYGFNLGTCTAAEPGGACNRGVHVCTKRARIRARGGMAVYELRSRPMRFLRVLAALAMANKEEESCQLEHTVACSFFPSTTLFLSKLSHAS